jgi:hypothetical protein
MRTFVTTARRALSVAAVAVILAGCTRAPQQQYEGIATDEPSVVPSATATNYSSPSMKPAPVATPTMKPVAPPAAADQEKVDAATRAFLDTLHVCDDPAAAAEVLRSLYKGPATEAFLREKVQKLQALRGCAQPPPSAARSCPTPRELAAMSQCAAPGGDLTLTRRCALPWSLAEVWTCAESGAFNDLNKPAPPPSAARSCPTAAQLVPIIQCTSRDPSNIERCSQPWSAREIQACVRDHPTLEDQVLNALRCDPYFQFQQVGRANPGMSNEVKAGTMQKLLEVYGCIPPQPAPAPASPELQITDCQWIGGTLSCLTH